mmetsp:Transcript_15844/g.18347  ORF Transcript_15844/g.18347 Transcript_15844/m.18347 type:complete len:171 (-) Transcript_15844:74-586(-)
MMKVTYNRNEEDFEEGLVDEGSIETNKVSYLSINKYNPLVSNKGNFRLATHDVGRNDELEEAGALFKLKNPRIAKSHDNLENFESSKLINRSKLAENKFVDSDIFDSVIQNSEEDLAQKGIELFLKIQKEESAQILANIDKINSDKRLSIFRRSIAHKSDEVLKALELSE